ncbi:hypothetical protein GCM10007094_19510 [Pseudovibrio japonicus]|uniref:Uncharacterized protein n=1 Tax=Pseudovibrio japonicus TaxID=366534 RepID=A0ABQ3EA05_9HYPH|nr:polysialyltransferase family glycosyltransferase [Pseudovibrio japonicus]GHB31143.1 hypothetical protein GCM10007094_19510 [Pseudovibrio japonicus]
MLLCEASTKLGILILLTIFKRNDDIPGSDRRILLVCNHTSDFEAQEKLLDYARNTPSIAAQFSAIFSLNQLIEPLHPSKWVAPSDRLQAMSTASLLRNALVSEGQEITHLLVGSIQAPPSKTLAGLFEAASVYVYVDGLMTFSPTRSKLINQIGSRIERLYFLDLLNGVDPALLREFSTARYPISPKSLKNVIADFSADHIEGIPKNLEGSPVFLGQYLSSLGLYSQEEEIDLYVRGLVNCAAMAGNKTVFFKPHPRFSDGLLNLLMSSPLLKNYDVRVLDSNLVMEEYLVHVRPAFICAVFSTGLGTANSIYGIPVFGFKTHDFLKRLSPYENSNRVPAAIVYHAYPDIEAPETFVKPSTEELQLKVDLLAAAMQPSMQIKTERQRGRLLQLSQILKDFVSSEANGRVAAFKVPKLLSFETLALSGAKPEINATSSKAPKKSPLAKARKLMEEENFEDAFVVSLKALQKTPDSTQHMRIVTQIAAMKGGLWERRAAEVRESHKAALKEKNRRKGTLKNKTISRGKNFVKRLLKSN